MAVKDSGTRNVLDILSHLENGSDTKVLTEEAINALSSIPEGYIPLPHQIAGHKHTNGKEGLLRNVKNPEVLLKPLVEKELKFYQHLQSPDATQEVAELRKFVPQFKGLVCLDDIHRSELCKKKVIKETEQERQTFKKEYLCLEDCVNPFSKASIVDLKIGKKFYEKGTDESKVMRTRVKYTILESAGFQIVGMRVYEPVEDRFRFYDITYGQGLSDDQSVNQGLLKFLDNGTRIRYDVLPQIIGNLTQIRDWLSKQTTFKLFSTSILLIYEGQLGHDQSSAKFDVRLVDFAHTALATDTENDPNCLCGVERILEHFQQIKSNCPDL